MTREESLRVLLSVVPFTGVAQCRSNDCSNPASWQYDYRYIKLQCCDDCKKLMKKNATAELDEQIEYLNSVRMRVSEL